MAPVAVGVRSTPTTGAVRSDVTAAVLDCGFVFPAASNAASCFTNTVTTPSAAGWTATVKGWLSLLVEVIEATVPFWTSTPASENMVTGSEKLTVKLIGSAFVGLVGGGAMVAVGGVVS